VHAKTPARFIGMPPGGEQARHIQPWPKPGLQQLVKAHLNLDDATPTAVTADIGKPIIVK
jgi:hypothetical protein